MKVLSATEASESFSWSAKLGSEYAHCDEEGVFFSDTEANCIDLEYPPKLERLPFFERFLAAMGYEDEDFEGALLWLPTGAFGIYVMKPSDIVSSKRCIGGPVSQNHLRSDRDIYFERTSCRMRLRCSYSRWFSVLTPTTFHTGRMGRTSFSFT